MRNSNPLAKITFAICVANEKYAASLDKWKVYRVLPDLKAAQHHYIRVIDESGEDYLYPESYFVPIRVPQEAQKALMATA